MKKIIHTALFTAIFLFAKSNLFCQVTISGPTCVNPGTVYQYTITGNWDSTSTMSICINGGAIYDEADTNECTPVGPPIAKVLVDWDTSGVWSLSLTSTSGNTTLNVSVITPLTPGSIDSASKVQMIGTDTIPATIYCSLNIGGSCTPSYRYQWQQSIDMVSWMDMQGANKQNLSIDSVLTQSWYFRRKVIEINSGSIAYSDVASVFVGVTGSTIKWIKEGIYGFMKQTRAFQWIKFLENPQLVD